MEVVHVGKGVFVCGNTAAEYKGEPEKFVCDMNVRYVLCVAIRQHDALEGYCRGRGVLYEHMPLRQGATPNVARAAVAKIRGAIGNGGAVLVAGETLDGKARRLAHAAVTGEPLPKARGLR